jgi:hypothetical protein
MNNVRLCHCGNILMSWSAALVCCFECLAAEYGGSLPRSDIKLGHISETTRKKIEAQASAQADGFNAIAPPSAVVTDFPSKYVQIVRRWEKRDEGLVDPAMIPLEREGDTSEDFCPKAASQAQVFWARGELAKAKRGGYTKLSIPELEALANTPLAGLPERAGQKAPAKKSPAKKATKAKATPKAKAKEA